MNCVECQENLVANLEGILNPEKAAEFHEHLAGCSDCQAEQASASRLHQRLTAHGEKSFRVAVASSVMGRIRRIQSEQPRAVSVLSGWMRWALGCGAATAALVAALMLMSPKATANAAEVMARGVSAAKRLTSVHLQCRVRSTPAENFPNINPKCDFTTVNLWKEWAGQGRWRVEKPDRVVVMDGHSTVQLLRPSREGFKVPAVPAMTLPLPAPATVAGQTLPEGWAPFDTGWLHAIADVEHTLTAELSRAQAKGWKMEVTRETTAPGTAQSVVTLEARSGLPYGDYLQNKSFETSDTRRVYRFDDTTGRLAGVQVYLHDPSGDVLIFEVTGITYNEVFDSQVFQLDLPTDVVWHGEKPPLSGEPARYADLTPEQVARAFFEACSREDWSEAGAFHPLRMDEELKSVLGGSKVVTIGESFTSAAYQGRFVPYEIELKNGGKKKSNLALKLDNETRRWFVDGGL